jgi:hypothetical protein
MDTIKTADQAFYILTMLETSLGTNYKDARTKIRNVNLTTPSCAVGQPPFRKSYFMALGSVKYVIALGSRIFYLGA